MSEARGSTELRRVCVSNMIDTEVGERASIDPAHLRVNIGDFVGEEDVSVSLRFNFK